MAMCDVGTPKRLYCLSNVCVVCCFSFIQTEITETGERVEKRLFKKKMKLTDERVTKIKLVLENFELDSSRDERNGICLKCFNKVERILHLQEECQKLKTELLESRSKTEQVFLSLPSPNKRTLVQKRLLRSPNITQPPKQVKPFPTTVIMKSPVHIPPLHGLLHTQFPLHQLGGQVLLNPTIQGLYSQQEFPPITEQLDVPKKQETRRSLKFSGDDKENYTKSTPDLHLLEGEVEVSVYYPSGKKSSFIPNETHRQICKVIQRNKNVEKCIIDAICKSHPEVIVSGAADIVSKECKDLCKRGSGSVLRERSYDGIFNFNWNKFYDEIHIKAPNTLKIVSSAVSEFTVIPGQKKFLHLLHSVATILHSRSPEMSSLHYQIGIILTHGGCKKRDIERLSKLGLCTSERSVQQKLSSWMEFLDSEILELKKGWIDGSPVKYQIVGDNWDKNILPSYRTTQKKTVSLHLFNAIVVVNRILPVEEDEHYKDLEPVDFIPSVQDQKVLVKELTFIVATSLINNIDQLKEIFEAIYPKHLEHKYSDQVGQKTKQFPIGLFDCNETVTADVIRLLKLLTEKYVPTQDEKMVEEVFFGGDRLTDERIQGVQQAMRNAATELQRLEGFISKIEDWHRMMNFMEAICKLTYNTTSQRDRGTAYYFRNLLNARNVKGEVKNSFRAYKHLYYSIFDGICCITFLNEFGLHSLDTKVELPTDFDLKSDSDKVLWLNGVCESIVKKWFFEGSDDLFQEIRDVFENPDHEENYYTVNANDGRFPCNFCEKSFTYVGSLKSHEQVKHQHSVQPVKTKPKAKKNVEDELYNYICVLFKLTALLKNLDTAIDMADGHRSVRSCKYQLPIFNKTQ